MKEQLTDLAIRIAILSRELDKIKTTAPETIDSNIKEACNYLSDAEFLVTGAANKI